MLLWDTVVMDDCVSLQELIQVGLKSGVFAGDFLSVETRNGVELMQSSHILYKCRKIKVIFMNRQ